MKENSTNIRERRGFSGSSKLYFIEFFRIYFMFLIISGHVWLSISPKYKMALMDLFHATNINHEIAVEYFFIIGGFFLYKRIASGQPAFELIKKTYLRLMPGFMFAFLLCVLLGHSSFQWIPNIIFLSIGTAVEKAPDIGYGGWFIGVYFWVSCFLIALFSNTPKRAFLILGVLIYIGFSLRTHGVKPVGTGYTYMSYFGAVGTWTARGIQSMGLGMVAAFLAGKMHFPRKCSVCLFFTIVECLCLVSVWTQTMITKAIPPLSYVGCQLIFMLFLISVSHSYGYISYYLNKASFIQLVSRYTFPALLGHIVLHPYVRFHPVFKEGSFHNAALVILGGTALGIVEYHLIERWLVPKIKNALSQDSSAS